MLQIADGTLQSISEGATRLVELNVRANSAALNSDQRQMLQSEYDAQVTAMNGAMQQASYNSQPLFGKSFSTSLGNTEINFTIPSLDTSNLSLGDNDALELFRQSIESAFSQIGSSQNQFSSSLNALFETRSNTLKAYSQIADTDIAQSVSDLKDQNLLTQSALFAQAHQQDINKNRVSALLA
jgi:flagellin